MRLPPLTVRNARHFSLVVPPAGGGAGRYFISIIFLAMTCPPAESWYR
jgi:hypothetical protein